MRKFLLATCGTVALMFGASTVNANDMDWSGGYVGGLVGYGWGNSDHCDAPGCVGGVPAFPAADPDGFLGGIAIGYNHQFANNVVIGVEADASLAGIDGSSGSTVTFGCAGVCATEIDFLATIRGRLGYSMGYFLPFVTGGLAIANIDGSIGTPVLASSSTTETAAVVGGGVEIAINNQWSAKIDYLHVFDLGTFVYAPAFCVPPGCGIRDNTLDVVRVGVNFHF